MVHKVFALSKDKMEVDRGPLSGFTQLPARRIEFRFGKFSLADFFDLNTVGTDSHFQFLNWTIDNNGAWDYAADTRGYTVGAIVAYESPGWGFHFAEALMPTVANGIDLQWNLRSARAENFEFILHCGLVSKNGVIRLLAYNNTANMGIYRVANQNFLAGLTATPEITAHPLQVTGKYGFALNIEQQLTPWISVYGRFGWNNGKTESSPTPRLIRAFSSASGLTVIVGSASSTAPESRLSPTQSNTITSNTWRSADWDFCWRRRTDLWPRNHLRKLLHRACLERPISRTPCSAHQQSRIYTPVFVGGLRVHLEF